MESKNVLVARYIRGLAAGAGDVEASIAFIRAKAWTQNLTKGAITGDYQIADVRPLIHSIAKSGSVLSQMAGLRKYPALTPVLKPTGAAEAAFVTEGGLIPVSADATFERTQFTRAKVASVALFTRELMLATGGDVDDIISAELQRACGLTLDRAMLDPDSGPAGTPPSLTDGITAVTGATPAAILSGMVETAIRAGRDLKFGYWVVHPIILGQIHGLSDAGFPLSPSGGGRLLGLPVIPSLGAMQGSDPLAVLIDAAGIGIAEGGSDISISSAASVWAGASFDTPVGLFQTDSLGVRVVVSITWQVLLPGSVQWAVIPPPAP